MAGAKLALPRLEPECNGRCKSKLDALRLMSVVTRGSDEESLLYMATTGICAQTGRVTDPHGRSVLQVAASLGKKKVVEWLLRFKEAKINEKDQESGYTPLHRSLYFGHVDVAYLLIENGANLALCDNDGLTPLDHATRDQLDQTGPPSKHGPNEVYIWGSNCNYNLGIGDHTHRNSPDILEHFRKHRHTITFVQLQKFHSTFLTSSGQVFTCGHGRGGRLGHGDEESALHPRLVKALQNRNVVQVALGIDHSLFLTSTGQVYSSGSNFHHQLGRSPEVQTSTSPQLISNGSKTAKGSSSKLPPAVGIGAARFHSLFWTEDSLYTWGLNAGQLGHLKGEKTIKTPKLVSSLNEKNLKIKQVVTSNGAIVVLLHNGEIRALHEYQMRKITKHVDVAKIEVVGGNLDWRVDLQNENPFLKITEAGGEALKVFILSKQGFLTVWDASRSSQTFSCIFNLPRQVVIRDISVHKAGLLLLSEEGVVFEGSPQKKGETRQIVSPPAKTSGSDLTNHVLKHPADVIKLKRVPGIFRGLFCAADPKGQNFCVLQALPNANLFQVPEVGPSTMAKDFQEFHDTMADGDFLTDVLIHVGTSSFPAHKFILASCSDRFAKEVVALGEGGHELLIEDMDPQLFAQILCFAYTKTCQLLRPGECPIKYKVPAIPDPPQRSPENLNHVDLLIDPSKISAYSVQKSKKKQQRKPLEDNREVNKPPPANALQALQDAADSLEVFGLAKALDKFDMINNNIERKESTKKLESRVPSFSRKSFPEMYDVEIQCEDGVRVFGHKCILAARLEYFRGMFSFGWNETSRGHVLNLPMPSKIVSLVLDYLYRDEAPDILKSEDPEFISNVLVVADQFLMPRLIQICEAQLASLLTLKNACEMLQFAFDYNAIQLQNSAMQFLSQNMASILESRTMSILSEDNQRKLAQYYQRSIPNHQSRRVDKIVIHGGPSDKDIRELSQKCPMSMEAFFEEEESLMLSAKTCSGSAKKRSHRRRTSSGEYDYIRRRNISSSSVGSQNSDTSQSDGERGKEDDDSLSLDDFEFEEKIQNINENVISNSNGFGHTLRAQCEEEQHLKSQTVLASNKSGSKKFQKKSQKQRREEADRVQSESMVTASVAPKTWSGWNVPKGTEEAKINDPPFPSLSEILHSPPQSKLENSSSLTKPVRTKKSSWKQLSFSEDLVQSPPTNIQSLPNPWAKVAPLQSPPSSSIFSTVASNDGFRSILSDQARQRVNLEKATSKSLTATQIEERALEELKEFYNVDNCHDEWIRIERSDSGQLATPTWNRFKR